jgi:hypothetical protein
MTAQLTEVAAWPSAAVASVFAAALALVGSLAVASWTTLRWRRDVVREEQEREWARIVWAVDLAVGADPIRRALGAEALGAMYDMRIAGGKDRPFVRIAYRRIVESRRGEHDGNAG